MYIIGGLKTAFGPENDDTLTTTSAGDVILGLGGNDSLTSTHNLTSLSGGDHNDTLTTTYTASPAISAVVTATQNGEIGDDNLSVTMSGAPIYSDVKVISSQYGGTGNDTINSSIGTG